MSFEVDTGGFSTSQPQSLTPGSSPTFAGLTLSSMTQGSVLFAGAGGVVSQDNANFAYNNSTDTLTVANFGSSIFTGSTITGGTFSNINKIAIGVANDPGAGNILVNGRGFFGQSNGDANLISNNPTPGAYGVAIPDLNLGPGNGGGSSTNLTFYRSAATSGYTGIESFISGVGPTPLLINAGNGGSVSIGSNNNPQAKLSIGTVAATAHIFNAWTDASNAEWAYLGDWGVTANVATYGTGKAGTGSTRNIQFVVGGTNKFDYGVTNSGAWSFVDAVNISGTTIGALSTWSGRMTITSAITDGFTVSARINRTSSSLNDQFFGFTNGLATDAQIGRIKNNDDLVFGFNNGVSFTPKITINATTGNVTLANNITTSGGTFLTTSSALTNGAAAQAGTLLNAPTAGNPTKWVPINDNGTTRYIPAW